MRRLMRLVAGVAAVGVGIAAAGVGAASAATRVAPSEAVMQEGDQNAGSLDVVIFRNGRKVEGEILEENDSTIRIRVVMAGGLSAVTTYNKSDILAIERGAGTEAASKPANKPAAKADDAKPKVAPSTGKTKVYFATLKGEFGRDISQTPLREVVRDARNHQPDYLIFQIDNDFKIWGQERREFDHAFDQLWRAEELAPILTQEIRDDPEWKKKPQLVFWVKRAMGGAAFLPFIAPTIYFHPEGKMGGIGRLEQIFGGQGDKVVQEKQFSLRLGHAEGLAISGGHEPKLVRAMCRTEYVLSVSFIGGKPVYFEDDSGDLLLTDDGQGENEDEDPFFGNDVLTLNAQIAQQIGFSRGTVERLEDLLYDLGIARDYTLVEGRAERILKGWSETIENTERQLRRLTQEIADTPITGDYDQRSRARGFHIKTIREMKSLLERYKEALNPLNFANPPMPIDNMITAMNLRLEELMAEARRDRR